MKEVAEAAKEEGAEDKPDFFTAIKEVGSIVEFGSYEQDNDQGNGKEPIEWIVLDVQDGKSLLISRYGLDCMPYHTQDGSIYWKNCSLRSWLYNELPEIAFTEAEQNSIRGINVDNSAKQRFSEPGANAESDSQERVFLLGYDEVKRYFTSDEERRCEPTAYATAQGAYVDDNGICSWWLRTPGYKQTADSILMDGTVGSQDTLSQSDVTVRPAIWVSQDEKTVDYEKVEAERERKKAERLQKLREKGIIGLKVSFGSYEQDNNLANGPEPIEWTVLDVEGGRALLISKYGLDSQSYSTEMHYGGWEKCTLRSWLNIYFLNTAFSDNERRLITETAVDNSDSQGGWWTGEGNNTTDRVFLLSYTETGDYFESDQDKVCQPTEYSVAQGAYRHTDGHCSWWLRSSTISHSTEYGSSGIVGAKIISNKGIDGDSPFYSASYAVRPAMWVDLKSDNLDFASIPGDNASIDVQSLGATALTPTHSTAYSNTAILDEAADEKRGFLSSTKTVGETVEFGTYEQDNDLTNGPEPIEWKVLDVQDGKALLISKYALDSQSYNNTREDVTWETCTIRTWLNEDFLNAAFSDNEKELVKKTAVDNGDNQGKPEWLHSWYNRTYGGNNTEDKIFLLSYAEARDYFASDEERICQPTAYAVSQGAYPTGSGVYCRWWLRSPGDYQELAAFVYSSGSLDNRFTVDFDYLAVRPAIWISLESDLS